jgi:hypothetical protein
MQWDFPGNGAWNSLSGLYCQVKRESLREWTREGESGREREREKVGKKKEYSRG